MTFTVVLLACDAHVAHDHARFPSLQRIDDIHATKLLEDTVVFLVPQII